MTHRQKLGKAAEEHAEALLRRHGLKTLTRNYRCRGGEIDLIMRDGEHLVFIEVRYRRHQAFGGALSSIDGAKQRRLFVAAQHYLMNTRWQGPCRFDAVGFDEGREPQWVRDAFTL
jgi:putative endonuclease